MKNIFFLLTYILILGCSSNEKTNQMENSVVKDIPLTKKDSAALVVESFYKWYLDSLYENGKINTPKVVLSEDSIYSLDTTKYLALLKRSGFFSNNFIEDQRLLIGECNKELITENGQKQYREARFMAIESNVCDFMNYFPWIGGQGEEIKKVEIISSKIDGDKAKVIVKAIEEIKVELVKENAKWKINKIYIH